MDTEMKISAIKVRQFREARAWSQDQLARASGLSLRTIQRIETDGVASNESRTCLAAAFNVQIAELSDAPAAESSVHTAIIRTTSFAFMLVGVLMLISGYIAQSPPVVLWLGAFFLAFGAIDYAVALKISKAPRAGKA